MDFAKVIADLRQELAHIDAAILSLERLDRVANRRARTFVLESRPNSQAASPARSNAPRSRRSPRSA